MKLLKRSLLSIAALPVVMTIALAVFQRNLLYFPTHEDSQAYAAKSGMTKWEVDGEYTGYARLAPHPSKIWLFTHGNGGQAASKAFVVRRIGENDSIYVLEYPGYGDRPGSPTMTSINEAALKAFRWLVSKYGVENIWVLGESLGSGPACFLATSETPPKHLVLVVPFDVITDVAQWRFPITPVRMFMLDDWNNVEALKGYQGTLDIIGAKGDKVIPVLHARKLADACPGSRYHEMDGSHSCWTKGTLVELSKL